MHQNLHPISPFVGKHIGMMRYCLSEVPNDSGQGRIGPSTHIHWFYCQPDFIHANHVSSSRINSASLEPSCVGHSRVMWHCLPAIFMAIDCVRAVDGGLCCEACGVYVFGGPVLTGTAAT